jgi:hypothetical protein
MGYAEITTETIANVYRKIYHVTEAALVAYQQHSAPNPA